MLSDSLVQINAIKENNNNARWEAMFIGWILYFQNVGTYSNEKDKQWFDFAFPERIFK